MKHFAIKRILLLFLIGWPTLSQAQESVDVQILERDVERIKATGDLRGGAKLMKALLRFREQDMLISGNDFRYGFLSVVAHAQIVSLTYSDIGGDLPKSMQEGIPLFNPDYAGQDQRWLKVVYTFDGREMDVFLMLPKETAPSLVNDIETRTGKPITRFVDGLPFHRDDGVFRNCRIFQTLVQKEQSKTDDFACLVILTDSAFVLAGRDERFQDQYTIPYAQMKTLYYEHGKQTSYMGRMPGLSAFRKPRHWFIVDYVDLNGTELTVALLLEAEEVSHFREAAEQKSKHPIKSFAVMTPPMPNVPTSPMLPPQPRERVPQTWISAKTIHCNLGPGYRVHWDNQMLVKDGETRFQDTSPNLIFDHIDWEAQTAQMHQSDLLLPVRLVLGDSSVTFIATGTKTWITTILLHHHPLLCVFSLHESGSLPAAEQFYGIAEIVEPGQQ